MTNETCPDGSWHKTDAEDKLCSNVRCVGVIRVIAKFGAKPQAFPYDIQKPNLEIKSKNYPSSMVKEWWHKKTGRFRVNVDGPHENCLLWHKTEHVLDRLHTMMMQITVRFGPRRSVSCDRTFKSYALDLSWKIFT